jgi:uncharacterized repeat protein (TIGR02543 family)
MVTLSSPSTSVTATFVALRTLTVNVTLGGGGSVTDGGVINCSGTCNNQYSQGSSVVLTESPATGYTFTGWSGDCSGTSTTCNGTMSADQSVTATFSKNPPPQYTLTVTSPGSAGRVTSGDGLINCPGGCSHAYSAGSEVTLTVTAASGYTFTSWSGDCSGTSTTCNVTMSADQSVTAAFTKNPPPPTPNPSDPSSISGTPQPGSTLTCAVGGFSGTGITYTYQWFLDGEPIPGQTGQTYIYDVRFTDEGHTVSCQVTAHNAGGQAGAATPGVFIGNKALTTCPKASGRLTGLNVGPLAIGMPLTKAVTVLRKTGQTATACRSSVCTPASGSVRRSRPSSCCANSQRLRASTPPGASSYC